MKRLILMRHAKSDWSTGAVNDHDRPLNARGRNAATKLGDWLRQHLMIPDQVLCSSAVRTRETLARLDLPVDVPLRHDPNLYLAEPQIILATLRTATGDSILMIGHNPGIAMMAEGILTTLPDHPSFAAYPTGATLVAEWDIDNWSDADWGQATARHFVVPRAL